MVAKILNKLRSEPVLVGGAVQAALTLAAAFGFHLSAEQVAAVTGFSAAVLAVAARSQVTPTVKPAPAPEAPKPSA
jgi:hypothetical protein